MYIYIYQIKFEFFFFFESKNQMISPGREISGRKVNSKDTELGNRGWIESTTPG